MNAAHDLILLGGALGVVSILAGLISARLGAPLLLVFLVLGMLAGEDGPGGIVFDDFRAAYLIGSIALAVILFDGGLATTPAMLRLALWPSLVMATAGVAVTAVIVGAAAVWLFGVPWTAGLQVGAAVAPTDAAAVSTLLHRARVAVPERVAALLEVESGLNDPMSVFLTVLLVEILLLPHGVSPGRAVLSFAIEMGGGAAAGLAGGFLLLWLLRLIRTEMSLYPVLALTVVLCVFGAAQRAEASGFLAVYLMGVIVGWRRSEVVEAIGRFLAALAWLAQIVLFLMLGLLVNPHELRPLVLPMIWLAAVLILLARPLAAAVCLLPLRQSWRETAFAGWVGLRGAVPIYLTIIPVLAGTQQAEVLFGAVFVIVIASLVIQGWTIGPAARLLGWGRLAGAR